MIQPVASPPRASKSEFAQKLADAHLVQEDSISRIVRLVSSNEDDPHEPLKLLEVNSQTTASGIVPVYFGTSDVFPIPTILIEITDSEFEELQQKKLDLPEGWRQGDVLYQRPGDVH